MCAQFDVAKCAKSVQLPAWPCDNGDGILIPQMVCQMFRVNSTIWKCDNAVVR